MDQLIEASIEFIDAKRDLYLTRSGNYVLVRSSACSDRSSSSAEITVNVLQKAKDNGYLIGGELGAAFGTAQMRATDYLRPIHDMLHLPENYRQIFANLKLKPSSKKRLRFCDNLAIAELGTFKQVLLWHDPLLTHAKSQMSPDNRLQETVKCPQKISRFCQISRPSSMLSISQC